MIPYRPARHKRLARALSRSVSVALRLDAVLDIGVATDSDVFATIAVGGLDGGGAVDRWFGGFHMIGGCRQSWTAIRDAERWIGAAVASLDRMACAKSFKPVDAAQHENASSRVPVVYPPGRYPGPLANGSRPGSPREIVGMFDIVRNLRWL